MKGDAHSESICRQWPNRNVFPFFATRRAAHERSHDGADTTAHASPQDALPGRGDRISKAVEAPLRPALPGAGYSQKRADGDAERGADSRTLQSSARAVGQFQPLEIRQREDESVVGSAAVDSHGHRVRGSGDDTADSSLEPVRGGCEPDALSRTDQALSRHSMDSASQRHREKQRRESHTSHRSICPEGSRFVVKRTSRKADARAGE